MAIGKLTGKVESKGAIGFAVRTPTAVVTDLGTEFGVEVDKNGHTTSHVFRGVIKMDVVSQNGKTTGVSQLLRENESVRVDGRQIESIRPTACSQFPKMPQHRPIPLVALYPFEGNFKDASGNGHDLQAKDIGDIVFVEGLSGQAARFDANAKSRIDLAIDARPKAMPRLTWGAWVRPRTVGPNPAEIITIDSKGYGRTLTINNRAGDAGRVSDVFRFATFLGDQGVDRGIFPSSGPLPKPNEWTFVAVAYDDSNHRISLFVEDKSLHGGRGGLVEDRTIGIQFGESNPFIRLGRHADWDADCTDAFDGDIDNFFVFRETLDAEVLEQIRQQGAAGILAIARGKD
jgi:hypothetical protein